MSWRLSGRIRRGSGEGTDTRWAAGWRCVAWCAVALSAAFAAAPADAKIVGLLFDDSGSMRGKSHLPSFGAQMLAAVIDGRPDHDRFLAIRLSDFVKPYSSDRQFRSSSIRTPFPLSSIGPDNVGQLVSGLRGPAVSPLVLDPPQRHQGVINDIADSWPNVLDGMPTPYAPLEILLEMMSRAVRPGEPAFLVVISDGDFTQHDTNRPPPADQLRRSYQTYRQRFPAGLRAHFLLIDSEKGMVESTVQQQAVRSTLLDVINGDPNDGRYTVDSFDALSAALRKIVAEISSMDVTQSGSYIRKLDNRIELNTPLSVNRLVTVSIADKAMPLPTVVQTDFAASRSRDLTIAMREADSAWRQSQPRGQIRHYTPDPALPPGTYSFLYDHPVNAQSDLLVDTNARLDIEIVDPAQGVIPPDANGVVRVLAKRDHQIRLVLTDHLAGRSQRVGHPGVLKDAQPRLFLKGGGRRDDLPVLPSPADAALAGTLPALAVGRYEVFGSLRLPGFSSFGARPVIIDAIDGTVSLAVRIQPAEACPFPECGPSDLPTSLRPSDDAVTLGRVVLAASAASEGTAVIALGGDSEGIEIRGADGTVHGRRAEFRVGPEATPPSFVLVRTHAWRERLLRRGLAPQELSVTAQVQPPLDGSATAAATVRPFVQPVSVELRTEQGGTVGAEPMPIDARSLLDGSRRFLLEVANSHDPVTLDTVKTGTSRWPVAVAAEMVGDRVQLVPHLPWWCHCFLGLAAGETVVDVAFSGFQGLQAGTARLAFRTDPSAADILFGCAGLLSVLLVSAWLAGTIVAYTRARRFPQGSSLEICERGDLPRYVRLRRSNHTLFRAALWFVLGIPHEVRREWSLVMRASPEGAELLFTGTWPDYYLERLGQKLEEIVPTPTRKDAIRIYWDDELREPGQTGVRIALRRMNG